LVIHALKARRDDARGARPQAFRSLTKKHVRRRAVSFLQKKAAHEARLEIPEKETLVLTASAIA